MTGNAECLGVPERSSISVATAALCLHVGAQQGEIRQRMVEPGQIDVDDRVVTALVFGMATGTVAAARFRHPTVITLPLSKVGADVLVADYAQLTLRRIR